MQNMYMFINAGSFYHTINLSIIMKAIVEATFPYRLSNAMVSLKSLLCLKGKWKMAIFLYLPLVFLFFLKCSRSWQQNQAKHNLDTRATALNVIRRIFSSIESIHQLLVGERGLPWSWRHTWNRMLWTWTTHEYLKIVTTSAVTKDGRMSSGSHMTGYFSHTTSFNVCI